MDIENLEEEMERLRDERSDLEIELEQLEAELEDMNDPEGRKEETGHIENKIIDRRTRINEIEHEVEKLEKQRDANKINLKILKKVI